MLSSHLFSLRLVLSRLPVGWWHKSCLSAFSDGFPCRCSSHFFLLSCVCLSGFLAIPSLLLLFRAVKPTAYSTHRITAASTPPDPLPRVHVHSIYRAWSMAAPWLYTILTDFLSFLSVPELFLFLHIYISEFLGFPLAFSVYILEPNCLKS
jgi:hypothetical protein